MNLSDRFKILRLLNGYTQTDLARKANLPQSSVANWENGKYGPGGDTGISLATILGVHPGYLFHGKPQIASAVWFPTSPKRKQHLQAMTKDIYELLPQLLTENKIGAFTPAKLKDGQAFLLGGHSERPDFRFLIVAETSLVKCFLETFSGMHLWSPISHEMTSLDKYTVYSFNNDALYSWGTQQKEDYSYKPKKSNENVVNKKYEPTIKINIDLVKSLQSYLINKGSGLEEITIKKDHLAFILQTVQRFVDDRLTDKTVQELSSLVIRQCEDSMASPQKPISKQSILAEVSDILGRSDKD